MNKSNIQEADGRLPVAVFMEKPSKKEYPDYYRIISDPIDMLTIEANIKYDKYTSTDELLKDFQVIDGSGLSFDTLRIYRSVVRNSGIFTVVCTEAR